jgi:hypothetical protein
MGGAVIEASGQVTQVRCKIYSKVEYREKLLVQKIDNLHKHAGRRRTLADIGKVKRGEFYYLAINQHIKNERIFYAKGGDSIVQSWWSDLSRSGGGKWYSSRPFS